MKQGWEIKKLGDITTSINGLWTGKKPPFITVAVIRNTNFTKDCKLDTSDIAYIDVEVKQYASRKLQCGDIIIEKSGGSDKQPVGRPILFNIEEGEYSFSNFTSTLRVDDRTTILPEFIHRYLAYIYMRGDTAAMQSKTTGIRNLDFTLYKSIHVPVPPREEQERIVAELDGLSGVIERKREQLRELDALAQSIFYQMFGDPITNEKGWEVKKLGEVCDVRDGTHDSPKYLEYSDYILITSKNITNDGNIDFSTANYISKEDYDAINKRSYVESGDIIMAMIGTIGKPIIVKETDKKFCIKNVALIKFGCSTMVINTYIKAMLNNPDYGQYIQSQNKGGTQKFVALGTIRNLPIPLPSMEIQQQFAETIEAIEKQKELIKQSIAETETLFNSRMEYYFN